MRLSLAVLMLALAACSSSIAGSGGSTGTSTGTASSSTGSGASSSSGSGSSGASTASSTSGATSTGSSSSSATASSSSSSASSSGGSGSTGFGVEGASMDGDLAFGVGSLAEGRALWPDLPDGGQDFGNAVVVMYADPSRACETLYDAGHDSSGESLTVWLDDFGSGVFPPGAYPLPAPGDAGWSVSIVLESYFPDGGGTFDVASSGEVDVSESTRGGILGNFSASFDLADGGSSALTGTFAAPHCAGYDYSPTI